MDKNMKNFDKSWMDSLSFIDNTYVKVTLCTILVLYSSTYFENINMYVGSLHKSYKFLNLLVLLLILYISKKCATIGILLGISYVISIHYMTTKENFNSGVTERFTESNPDSELENFADADSELENFADDDGNEFESFVDDGAEPEPEVEKFNDNEGEDAIITEPFFPGINISDEYNNSNEYNISNNNNVRRVEKVENKKEDCKSLYTSRFENISDVCSPVNTFKDSLNAQGLNSPEGYNSLTIGSPL
jgi:hypothetical protein